MTINKTTTVVSSVTLTLEEAIATLERAVEAEARRLQQEAKKEEAMARKVEALRLKAEALGLPLPQGFEAPSQARGRLAALEAVDPEARRTKVVKELTRKSQGKPWAWRVRRAIEEGRLPQEGQIDQFLKRLEEAETKAKAKK